MMRLGFLRFEFMGCVIRVIDNLVEDSNTVRYYMNVCNVITYLAC